MASEWLPERLPEDLDAEKALLATCCAQGADKEAFEIVSCLRESDFVHPAHKAIFRALVKLTQDKTEVNSLTLKDALGKAGHLERVGGYPGLVEILAGVEVGRPTVLANILIGKRKLRALIGIGAQLVRKAVEDAASQDLLVDWACQELAGLSQDQGDDGPQLLSEIFPAVMERWVNPGKFAGLKTGFQRLDSLTGGLKPGQLMILAARPGVGKTSFALNIAKMVADEVPVVVFSLEMSREEIADRLLAAEANLDLRTLNPRDSHQIQAIAQARRRLESLPLHLDDRGKITVRQIRSRVERLAAKRPLGMVIVDYLGLISSPEDGRSSRQTEAVRIAEITRELKLMAKDCRVPVIVMSQLNREVEHRQGGKPQLSDLRDSGAIEQDADLVVFIDRKVGQEKGKDAELIMAKQRNGPTGTIPLEFIGEVFRFQEVERTTADPRPRASEMFR